MIGVRDFKPYNTPAIDLPPAGSAYIDPIFGTRIIRVTDERTGRVCQNGYPWWPVWNADESAILIFVDDVATVVPWHGDGGPDWANAFALASIPGCPKLDSVSAQWDRSDPRVLYVIEATAKGADKKQRIVRFNLQTRSVSQIRRFNAELPGCELTKLSMSENGEAFSFTAVATDGSLTACVWDWRGKPVNGGQLIKFTDPLPAAVHSTTISVDGQWVQVACAKPTPDLVFWRWADHKVITVPAGDTSSSGIIEHAYLGRSGLVSGVAANNGVAIRRWEDFKPKQIFVIPDGQGGFNWKVGHHVAVRKVGGAEVSVILVTYMGEGTPCANELIEVAIDGSWWRRLAHTRATAGGTYVDDKYPHQPRGSVSPSGRYVVWTSDLGNPDRTDVLVMVMPPADEVLERDEDAAEHMTDLMQERDAARAELAHAEVQVKTLESTLDDTRAEVATARAVGDELRQRMVSAITALGVP